MAVVVLTVVMVVVLIVMVLVVLPVLTNTVSINDAHFTINGFIGTRNIFKKTNSVAPISGCCSISSIVS